MADDFEHPELDEDKVLASLKRSMEQSARGEGRPVAEHLAEAKARFKERFAGHERPAKPAQRKTSTSRH
jgi:hypothetical protein